MSKAVATTLRLLGVVLLSLAVAGAGFNGFIHKWGFLHDARSSLRGHFEGTVVRPFAYRTLFTDVAEAVAPAPTHGPNPPGGRIDRPGYLARVEVVYFMTFASFLLLLWGGYRLGRDAGFGQVAAYAASAAMLLFFPMIQSNGGYWYDFLETGLFCLFLVAARRGSWPALLALTAVGAWNKESFLFFIVAAWPLLREGKPLHRAAAMGMAALAIAAAIYEVQRIRFAGFGGGAAEIHVVEQLRHAADLRSLIVPEWTYGLPLPHALGLLSLLALLGLGLAEWPRLAPVRRAHALVAAALNLPMFLVLCAPGEARDLSLLFPTLILLMAGAIQRTVDRDATAAAALRPLPA